MPFLVFDYWRLIGMITGTDDFLLYTGQWFWAFIGVFASLYVHSLSRDKSKDFSLAFLLRDNGKRLMGTCILILIFLRFPELFFNPSKDTGEAAILLTSFAIGYLNDKLAQFLKSINFMGMKETKIRKTLRDENTPDPL